MKKIIFIISVIIVFASTCFAEESLTVLISGQAHSTLYPCLCPHNPEGGVSRRANVINNIRKEKKNVLLLESGLSFAGGDFDGENQDQELNKKRTEYYLKALMGMRYDAFLISNEEFNFGDEFLNEMTKKYPLNYLSANLGKKEFQPYIIKEFGKAKVAIIGLSDPKTQDKTKKAFADPKATITKIIKEIDQDKKADLIVVLSSLNPKESEEIISQVKGINLWVNSDNPYGGTDIKTVSGVTVVTPRWQSRQLTRLDYVLGEKEIRLANSDNISLGKDIKDDEKISSIVPICFSDKDCAHVKANAKMVCENPASEKAKCKEFKPTQVALTMIKPSRCITCVDTKNELVEQLKAAVPDLIINNLTDNDNKAKELIKQLGLRTLPVYLLDKTIAEREVFANIQKDALIDSGNYYIINPSLSGLSYFIDRKEIKNRLDVFFDIATPRIADILAVLNQLKDRNKNIDIHLNLLAVEDDQGNIVAKGGQFEIEEYLRFACVNKYFPNQARYYLSCRLSEAGSSWWDDCANKFKIDPQLVKNCAQTQEGKILLRDFIKLTKDLEIVFGPIFLINNNEVFSVSDVPKVEELEKLFKK